MICDSCCTVCLICTTGLRLSAGIMINVCETIILHKYVSFVCISGRTHKKNSEITCVICVSGLSESPDEIVICDKCELGKLHNYLIFF